jgi:uncharacterized coiled-coil protein SlyX
MGSLLEELERREAAARAEAEELRGRIAELTERLAGVEERLARLVVTRETVEEVLGAALEVPPASPAGQPPSAAAGAGAGRSPVIGVVTVPPWRAGLEVSVLPRDYRDLLEVAEDAGRPVRAAQIAAAAGLSTQRGKVESLRGKLKRLVERGWLAEERPGLFALPARGGGRAGEGGKPG